MKFFYDMDNVVKEATSIYFIIEILFLFTLFTFFIILPRIYLLKRPIFLDVLSDRFNKFSQNAVRSIVLTFTFALFLPILATFIQPPYPVVTDELSTLICAETLSQGRLTNPTHPMWEYFETFHVIHKPSYQSKFPPAGALFMAVGIWLTGLPIAGVWLSYALAMASLCWFLRMFMPSNWALAASLAAAGHGRLLQEWALGYWGGSVGMLGGILFLGSIIQLYRMKDKYNWVYAITVSIALLLLFNSRPFEGLITVIPGGILITFTFIKRHFLLSAKAKAPQGFLRSFALPSVFVLSLGILCMMGYNQAVTGNFLRMPYMEYGPQYEVATPFIFIKNEEPEFRHPILKKYSQVEDSKVEPRRSLKGALYFFRMKLKYYGDFFIRIGFLLPFIIFILKKKKLFLEKFMLITLMLVLLFAGLCSYEWPHYISPASVVIIYMIAEGTRMLKQQVWSFDKLRKALLYTTLSYILINPVLGISAHVRQSLQAFTRIKSQMEENLIRKGGKHLVLVGFNDEYPLNKEWVYNGADLENAPVIWARERYPSELNKKIIQYYHDREVWHVIPSENMSSEPQPYDVKHQAVNFHQIRKWYP
jgi:hypothetical protein